MSWFGMTDRQEQKKAPAPSRGAKPSRGILRRKCSCEEKGGAGGCEECRKKKDEPLRRSARTADDLSDVPPIVYDVLRTSGHPLDESTRAYFEPRFGHDFSQVRVHTDERARQSAAAVNAEAYTVGSHIAMGRRSPTANSNAGRQLLAHELVHVLQQARAGPEVRQPIGIDEGRSPHERIATTVAGRILDSPSPVSNARPVAAVPALIQRQEMCPGVIYDEEEQVCRMPDASEYETVPDSSEVDGEFWIVPPKLRRKTVPIFDDSDTLRIVGFRYSSSGYWEIYDLEGNLVESGEKALETPLIDPIDILAGGITGLGRGVARGGLRALGRGAAGAAGGGAGRAGLAVAIRALSTRTAAAIRATYRAIRFRGALQFTGTTALRMADPARRVPHHILKLAIQHGKRVADPQGAAGAFKYTIQMFRNGKEYTLEVVLREADRTVLHFLYR